MLKIDKMELEYVDKTEQIYRLLRSRILEGKLAPGSRLIERKLAEELNVSKTPVREALVRLSKDGLLDGESHRGFWVAELTGEEAREIYDLREMLEGFAAREAAKKINQQGCTKLASFVEEFEVYYNQRNLTSYNDTDIRFHNFLIEISSNQRLYHLVSHLRAQSRLLMATSVNFPGRATASLSEHKKIIEAVVDHNEDLAEKYAREHIRSVRKAALNRLVEDAKTLLPR